MLWSLCCAAVCTTHGADVFVVHENMVHSDYMPWPEIGSMVSHQLIKAKPTEHQIPALVSDGSQSDIPFLQSALVLLEKQAVGYAHLVFSIRMFMLGP